MKKVIVEIPSTDDSAVIGFAVVDCPQEQCISDYRNEFILSSSKHTGELKSTTSHTLETISGIGNSSIAPSLLRKLAALSPSDMEGLEHLLGDWAVPELRRALCDIERRLTIAEIIRRLAIDPSANERTLHRLVLEALWIFGPEYESARYCSDASLRTIGKRIFGRADVHFANERVRPDIVMTPENFTCGFARVEELSGDHFACTSPNRIALIELKRGGSKLTRRDLGQADGYAQDIADSGIIPASSFLNVWVVAGQVGDGVATDRFLANGQRCYARVRATTFGALADAARKRLPKLLGNRSRHESMTTENLFARFNARTD